MKEACFISQVTKWSIFNYKDLDQKNEEKSKIIKNNKKTKIFPRSNSDNLNAIKPNRLSSHQIKPNTIQTKIVKVNITNSKANSNLPENKKPYLKEIEKNQNDEKLQIQENLIKSQIREFQKNVMMFESRSGSEKSFSIKPLIDQKKRNEYQKHLMQFSNNSSEKKLDPKKFDLLKLSSVHSSMSSLGSKMILKEQFAKNMPREFINVNDDKEKILDVVMNQRKSTASKKANMFIDLSLSKELNSKKMKYVGVKKSFYLFKKQPVFIEDKVEDSKNKSSSGHFETVIKK